MGGETHQTHTPNDEEALVGNGGGDTPDTYTE